MRFLVLLILLTACRPGEPSPAPAGPPAVTLPESIRLLKPAEAAALIDSLPRLHVIDCRMDEEFQHGRIAGAHHVNHFKPEQAREYLNRLERERPVLVYCALGGRAGRTALLLHEMGFRDVSVLEGGFAAWQQQGLPVAR